jgi:hypothetical protein
MNVLYSEAAGLHAATHRQHTRDRIQRSPL